MWSTNLFKKDNTLCEKERVEDANLTNWLFMNIIFTQYDKITVKEPCKNTFAIMLILDYRYKFTNKKIKLFTQAINFANWSFIGLRQFKPFSRKKINL